MKKQPLAISPDENTITTPEGRVYKAVDHPGGDARESCAGCAFVTHTCERPYIEDGPYLCSSLRKDGRSVIWVEEKEGVQ